MLLCFDGVDCGVACFDDGFEGVWLNIFDVLILNIDLGGVFCGVVDMRCILTLPLGLGDVRLIEGEVYAAKFDGDFPGAVALLLGGVIDVILDLTTVGSAVIDLATMVLGDV